MVQTPGWCLTVSASHCAVSLTRRRAKVLCRCFHLVTCTFAVCAGSLTLIVTNKQVLLAEFQQSAPDEPARKGGLQQIALHYKARGGVFPDMRIRHAAAVGRMRSTLAAIDESCVSFRELEWLAGWRPWMLGGSHVQNAGRARPSQQK